jgi:hypothetical protein
LFGIDRRRSSRVPPANVGNPFATPFCGFLLAVAPLKNVLPANLLLGRFLLIEKISDGAIPKTFEQLSRRFRGNSQSPSLLADTAEVVNQHRPNESREQEAIDPEPDPRRSGPRSEPARDSTHAV